ncbi:MAG: glycosyltransferase family 4 protein [bacterium]|nr:MAG: glycosyltransferase family 4 protein [bacterium]
MDKSMRIAILTFGGHAYYPHLLVRSLLSFKYTWRVFAPDIQQDEYRNIIGNTENIIFYPKPRMRHLQNISVMRNLIESLEEFQPDLVHLLAYYPWLTPFSKRLEKFKLILTVHDPRKHKGDIASKIVPGSEKFFFQKATHIITLGRQMRQEIIRIGNVVPDKISVVSHGNYNIYNEWIQPGTEVQPNRILFFGRLYAYKGLEYLIQAAPLISQHIPDAQFVIAGEGKNSYSRNVLKKVAGNKQFRVYNEYISDHLAAQLFQESSLLVLPYIDASQSGPLMMSYAFKKPVVATDVGSLPEYVDHGQTGFLVPPKNSVALADKIICLLKDNGLRAKMGMAGYHKSVTDFAWEKIAQETLNVYRRALDI